MQGRQNADPPAVAQEQAEEHYRPDEYQQQRERHDEQHGWRWHELEQHEQHDEQQQRRDLDGL